MNMEASNSPKLHRFLGGFRGHLSKQGKVFKQWRQRYFVLENHVLNCYIDDSKAQAHGEVLIDDATQIYDVTEAVEGMRYLLYVIGRNSAGADEVMFLSAANEKDKQDWIEAIIDQVHNGFKQICQTDLWPTPFFPSVDMVINYANHASAENGNILRPFQIESAPEVIVKNTQQEDRFSLIMIDMDCIPSIDGSHERTYLHWAILNFANGDLRSGDEVAPYQSPAPLYDSGLHRYFFLLFQQTQALTPLILNEVVEMMLKREGFPLAKWAKCMDFEQPVAINGFYSGWEEYCDVLHRKSNLLPPDAYRSPGQQDRLASEQEQQLLEKAKLELCKELALRDMFGELDAGAGGLTFALSVVYNEADAARDGGILSAKLTEHRPAVSWKSPVHFPDDMLFTLMLCDPDEPSRVKPTSREYMHWMVVNIPASALGKGTEVLAYEAPGPAYASGLHRYVFSLYQQSSLLSLEEVAAARSYFDKRVQIRSNQWVRTMPHRLQPVPVAIEAFLCEWDEHVDIIHASNDFLPAPEYRSPAQGGNPASSSPAAAAALSSASTASAASTGTCAAPVEEEQEHGKEQWARREALEAEQNQRAAQAESSFRHSLEHPLVVQTSYTEAKGPSSPSMESKGSSHQLQQLVQGSAGTSNPLLSRKRPSAVNAQALSKASNSTADIYRTLAESSVMPTTSVVDVASMVTEVQEEEVLLAEEVQEEVQRTQVAQQVISNEEVLVEEKVEEQVAYKGVTEEEMRQLQMEQMPSIAASIAAPAAPIVAVQDLSSSSSEDLPMVELSSASADLSEEEAAPIVQKKKPALQRNPSMLPSQRASIATATASTTASSPISPLSPVAVPRTIAATPSSTSSSKLSPHQRNQDMYAKGMDGLDELLAVGFSTVDKKEDKSDDEDDVPMPLPPSIAPAIAAASPSKPEAPSLANIVRKHSLFKPRSQIMSVASPNAGDASSPTVAGTGTGGALRRLLSSKSMYHKPQAAAESIRAALPPNSSSIEQCEAFKIESHTVFEGEVMKKKYISDFMFKESFIWIVPATKSLHWSKSTTDRSNAKYIVLDRLYSYDEDGSNRPAGEMKGLLKAVEHSGLQIIVHLENGDFLELKVGQEGVGPAPKRAADWAKVLRSFLAEAPAPV